MKDDNSGPLSCHNISNKDSSLFGYNEAPPPQCSVPSLSDDGSNSSKFNIIKYLQYSTFAVMFFMFLEVPPALPIFPPDPILQPD